MTRVIQLETLIFHQIVSLTMLRVGGGVVDTVTYFE